MRENNKWAEKAEARRAAAVARALADPRARVGLASLPATRDLSRFRGDPIDVRGAVRGGWALFCRRPVAFTAFSALALAARCVPALAGWAVLRVAGGPAGTGAYLAAGTGAYLAAGGAALACAVALGPLRLGVASAGLAFVRADWKFRAVCRGEYLPGGSRLAVRGPFTYGAFLGPYRSFAPLLVADSIVAICVAFGGLAAVVPGAWLAVTFAFVPLAALEYSGDYDVVDVVLLAHGVGRANFWRLVALGCASAGILALGLLAFGVGVFVALPVVELAWVRAFKKSVGLHRARDFSSACAC